MNRQDIINKGAELDGTFPNVKTYIISQIIEEEQSSDCSFLHLIKNVFKTGSESYFPLVEFDLLSFHNKFYKNKKFLDTFKKDFSGKDDFEKMSVDNKIAIIAYTMADFFGKIEEVV